MPNYDYQCEKCHKQFEAFQAMSAVVFKSCPEGLCRQKAWGHGKVRRLIGKGAGLLFKGTGFHATDNRSAGYQRAEKKEWGGETRAEAPPRSDGPSPD